MGLMQFKFHNLLLVIVLSLIPVSTNAVAQNSVATKDSKTLELEAVRRKLDEARQRQSALQDEIAALDRDVGAINRALIETAKRGQELEGLVTQSEVRLNGLLETQTALKTSLNSKRGLLSEVLASLQRLGKNPPPALFIRPEDALASVRSSILLSAVVPSIKQESDILFGELSALTQTSQAVIAEKQKLANSLNALAEDETRLSLLVEEKNELATKSREDLKIEQQKSADLASQALSLKQFIKDLESQITSAAVAARSAKAADEKRQIDEQKRLRDAQKRLNAGQRQSKEKPTDNLQSDMNRIEPAIAFSRAKGRVLLPVSGVLLTKFGATVNGVRRTNIALVTRANARVRAPNDGWIVYAGPFRSYGQIIIINAGEGYHMVLSGLAQTNVTPGRFVLAGEPIGRMGTKSFAAATTTNLGSNQPILSVELRKDSKPIDPTAWWAVNPNKDVQISARKGT